MHPDVQKYIDMLREATEKQETDPFTVTDEELDEIQETRDIPYFLKYEAL